MHVRVDPKDRSKQVPDVLGNRRIGVGDADLRRHHAGIARDVSLADDVAEEAREFRPQSLGKDDRLSPEELLRWVKHCLVQLPRVFGNARSEVPRRTASALTVVHSPSRQTKSGCSGVTVRVRPFAYDTRTKCEGAR